MYVSLLRLTLKCHYLKQTDLLNKLKGHICSLRVYLYINHYCVIITKSSCIIRYNYVKSAIYFQKVISIKYYDIVHI